MEVYKKYGIDKGQKDKEKIDINKFYLSILSKTKRRRRKMNNTLSKYYYCYSPIQKSFFTENGYMYLDTHIHHGTGKRYWIFKRTTTLDSLCKQFKEHKEKILHRQNTLLQFNWRNNLNVYCNALFALRRRQQSHTERISFVYAIE